MYLSIIIFKINYNFLHKIIIEIKVKLVKNLSYFINKL